MSAAAGALFTREGNWDRSGDDAGRLLGARGRGKKSKGGGLAADTKCGKIRARVGHFYKVWKNTKLVYKVVGELCFYFCQNNKNTKLVYKVVGDAQMYQKRVFWCKFKRFSQYVVLLCRSAMT